MQLTLAYLETDDASLLPARIGFQNATYRRNRKTGKLIDSCFGPVTISRWFYQNTLPGEKGLAPLDVRLGLFAGRMTPALSEVVGRLAADLPQQAVLEMLRERFSISPGIATLRKVIADLGRKVAAHHDQAAVERLGELIDQAEQSTGKHQPLLQVGRDGVFVQTRPCWEEASCATLAVYDRSRQRLGTVYLGQMPEREQLTMTARLTTVIMGTLLGIGGQIPKLRYVTDAGCHPQAYFKTVLQPMKHPLTGQPLRWSWGVDFYHACEYITTLAASLLGASSEAAQSWASKQRQVLKTKHNGIARVIASAAQQKRRHGLKGTQKDYQTAVNYLRNYRQHMDYATRRKAGEPIGSGVTEAGCKVIFNQRLKQSGMRWYPETGQYIVDLRTAVRGKLWDRIWDRIVSQPHDLPPITRRSIHENRNDARNYVLLS
jgi:hypothetical protein